MARFISVAILIIGLLTMLGCSGTETSPVLPSADNISSSIPVNDNTTSPEGTELYGVYTLNFDLENMSASAAANREAGAHFNVTSYLPAPSIQLNSFNPSTSIADVDMTVSNTFGIDGYDLRVVVYTDAAGHKLVNFDSWTGLFDIAGGLPINPFKAYRKSDPNRKFPGKSDDTQNLQVYLPGGNPNVTFAIEVSYPTNCDEPYEMNNFTQGILYDSTSSSTNITIDVYDWQSNVSAVQIYCPALTGGPLGIFQPSSPLKWEHELINATGAAQGNYTAYILAASSGVYLYTEVKIAVTHQSSDVDPVGNLEVISVNRGEYGLNINQITSVDFGWAASNGAVEYAFERADGYTATGWTVVGETTSTSFKFIPTNYDLDEDIRFRVIARAVPGGDPATDADPSEEVFILFMSNMGDIAGPPGENNWKVVKKTATDGLDLRRWYWGVDDWGECGLGFYGDNQVGVVNINTWAIGHIPFEVPNLVGQTEAYFDGFISPGANWNPPSLGFCIGTLSAPPTQGTTCYDFEPATDILNPSYFAYNNPNCQGINQQFGETNQGAWKLTPDFGPPHVWRHVGYYLNDLLDPSRNYIALGFANGDTPLTPGTT